MWYAVVGREAREGDDVLALRRADAFLGETTGVAVRVKGGSVVTRRADGAVHTYSRGDVAVASSSASSEPEAQEALRELVKSGGPLCAVRVPWKPIAAALGPCAAEQIARDLVDAVRELKPSALRVQGLNAPVHAALRNEHTPALVTALISAYPAAASELDVNRRNLLQVGLRANAPAELLQKLIDSSRDLLNNEDNEARGSTRATGADVKFCTTFIFSLSPPC